MDVLRPVARSAPISAYAQIAQQLREAIMSQDVEAGAKLPPEPELVERFGVSRMTVREGVRVLRLEGVLRAEHGVGTFVEAVEGRFTTVTLPQDLGSALAHRAELEGRSASEVMSDALQQYLRTP